MPSTSLNSIAVLSISSANYGCIINGISKNDALNLCQFYQRESNIMKVNNYNEFIAIYKTGKEIIMFGNIEVGKHKFHQYKSSFWINNMDISKIAVPNRVLFGEKDFKFLLDIRRVKKLDFYAKCFQK